MAQMGKLEYFLIFVRIVSDNVLILLEHVTSWMISVKHTIGFLKTLQMMLE